VIIAFSLTVGLMIGETIAAYFANSLALFADSTHLLVHNSSLMIALISSVVSFNLAKKKSNKSEVIDIIGGMINCSIFLSIAIIIFFKGFDRLDHHESMLNINPIIMAISSLVAFCVHCIAAYVLSKGKKHSFNVHAIFLHTFFDCISTILTFIASIIIFFTNFAYADSIVSMIIAILVAFSGIRLLKKCIKKALNLHNNNVLINKISTNLKTEFAHIKDIHEEELNHLKTVKVYSAHIVLNHTCVSHNHNDKCLKEINEFLSKNFDINDTILQLEYTK
jgi:cobalt-zinc-cadmium efflux system protein